ncbi:MAG: ABC transporter ATP-binding protein, partial [Paracoccus sp. (in: a-proteobacteria)]
MSTRDWLARQLLRGVFGGSAQAWLVPVLARALPGIGLVLAGSLVAALIGLVPPWLTKLLIDRGLIAQDWQAVLHYAGAGFAVGLAILAGSVGNSLMHLHFSARMLVDLRARMLDALLFRRPDRPTLTLGETMARIDGDTAEIQRFGFDTVLATASSVFRLVGGTIMLFVLDWRLALIPLLAAPVNLGFLVWARPRTRRRAEDLRTNRGEVSAYLAEGFAGLTTLRSLGAQPLRAAGFAPLQARQVALLMRQRRWSESVGAVPQVTSALVRMGILLGGGWLVVTGQWQVGALIAFLGYVGMMTGPLQNLLGLYHAQAQA